MSLTALPVTSSDLTTLQQGLTFTTNAIDAANQANAINAPGATVTVFTYAASLLNANVSLSQVAMGLFPFMTGVTDSVAHIGAITTQFLPAQVTFAVSKGFNPTVFAAEAYGSALSTNAAFNANFVTPFANNPAGFAANVSAATGVSAAAILQFVNNWTAFFTQNPSALQGRTVTQASFGSAFGDAFGTALLTPGLTSNIATVFTTNPNFPFSPNTVQGIVANALIDNAEGLYNAGVALGTLPPHNLLQGEAGVAPGTFNLTINPDIITTNFANPIFNGLPGQNVLGPSNTLNAGDNLVSTTGNGTLNYTAVASLLGNPALAAGVTMTGISTANILNLSAGVAGFSGAITGLTTANMLAGTNGNILLGLASAGLNTALTTIGLSANSGFTAWFAPAALAGAANQVQINLNAVDAAADLLLTSGTNGYELAIINSTVGANIFDLDVDGTTLVRINAIGSQTLDMSQSESTALNIANLHTFDGTAATGRLIIEFNGTGNVTADGGSNNDDFTFPATNSVITARGNAGDDVFRFLSPNAAPTTFTAADSVDGGTGLNRLILQADLGALLGAGVGAKIVNIQVIEHITNGEANGLLTVDMAQSGSANILELHGDYGDGANNNAVTVNNLLNSKFVAYTGEDLGALTLDHASLVGTVNFTMAQSPPFGPGGTQSIDALHIGVGNLLAMVSGGNANLNFIQDVSDVNANVSITQLSAGSAVNLTFGDPFGSNAFSYDFPGGIIDAVGFVGNLNTSVGVGAQTVIAGLGNDYIEVTSASAPDLINIGSGASASFDSVEFESTFDGNDQPVTNANYTLVTGFSPDNDIIVLDVFQSDLDNISNTFTGTVVAPGSSALPLVYTTNTVVNAQLAPGFNFIKVDTPVNLLNAQDAQDGFNIAIGGAGNINVNGGGDDYLIAYFDATHQQMVLGIADDPGGNITAGDDFDVIALIGMNKTQYDAFAAGNLAFTDL